MPLQIANPWHQPGKGTVGPFYEVPDKPFVVGCGFKFYRTRAGSVLVVDEKGRAVSEVAGLSRGPEGYVASNAHRFYATTYDEDGKPHLFAGADAFGGLT